MPSLPDGGRGVGDAQRSAFTLHALHSRHDTSRITALALDPWKQHLFIGLSSGHVEEFQLRLPYPDIGLAVHGQASMHGVFPDPGPPPPGLRSSRGSSVGGSSSSSQAMHAAGMLPPHPQLGHSGPAGGVGVPGLCLGHPVQQQGLGPAPPQARFVGSRRVSKKGVVELVCLPVAQRVVARCDDGSVWMWAYEGSQLHALPGVRSALALAGDGQLKAPARLAVACKGGGGPTQSSRGSSLMVFAVASGPGAATTGAQSVQLLAQVSLEEPVLSLAWVRDSVLLALPSGYKVVAGGKPAAEVASAGGGRSRVVGRPGGGEAALVMNDSLVVLSDSRGQAVSPPLLLPESPLALAVSGLFLVAVGEEQGIQVYERPTASRVQQLEFEHDDAWVKACGVLACCEDLHGGHIFLATSHCAFCLLPVAHEAQVRELLKRRCYAAALQFMTTCQAAAAAPGSQGGGQGQGCGCGQGQLWLLPWVPPLVAQAGLLLLQDVRFTDGLALLAALPPGVFPPHLLLPLFPSELQALGGLPPGPGLQWRGGQGATGQRLDVQDQNLLPSLDQLVADRLELLEATAPPAAATFPSAAAPTVNQEAGQKLGSQQPRCVSQAMHEQVVHEAKLQVAAYLLQVRQQPGLLHQELLDGLCLQLLLATGQVGVLEGFVARPDNRAQLRAAVAALSAARRWHALALLRAAHNHCQEALQLWEQLASGQLHEAESHPPHQGSNPSGDKKPSRGDVSGGGSNPSPNTVLHAPTAAHQALDGPRLLSLLPGVQALQLPVVNPYQQQGQQGQQGQQQGQQGQQGQQQGQQGACVVQEGGAGVGDAGQGSGGLARQLRVLSAVEGAPYRQRLLLQLPTGPPPSAPAAARVAGDSSSQQQGAQGQGLQGGAGGVLLLSLDLVATAMGWTWLHLAELPPAPPSGTPHPAPCPGSPPDHHLDRLMAQLQLALVQHLPPACVHVDYSWSHFRGGGQGGPSQEGAPAPTPAAAAAAPAGGARGAGGRPRCLWLLVRNSVLATAMELTLSLLEGQ